MKAQNSKGELDKLQKTQEDKLTKSEVNSDFIQQANTQNFKDTVVMKKV